MARMGSRAGPEMTLTFSTGATDSMMMRTRFRSMVVELWHDLMEIALPLATLCVLLCVLSGCPRLGASSQNGVPKAKADLASLRMAIDQFRLDCGRYPTVQEGFGVLTTRASGLAGWRGPYLRKPVGPDPWGNPYLYFRPGPDGRDGYIVESYGADGRPGGSGEDSDFMDGSD